MYYKFYNIVIIRYKLALVITSLSHASQHPCVAAASASIQLAAMYWHPSSLPRGIDCQHTTCSIILASLHHIIDCQYTTSFLCWPEVPWRITMNWIDSGIEVTGNPPRDISQRIAVSKVGAKGGLDTHYILYCT